MIASVCCAVGEWSLIPICFLIVLSPLLFGYGLGLVVAFQPMRGISILKFSGVFFTVREVL
ncbi:hypothetical protein RHGRI_031182 [Rhododendron griersonianum]|nr:hypothetical protein RHGRI_031182 [Rhododendron griersonianum]